MVPGEKRPGIRRKWRWGARAGESPVVELTLGVAGGNSDDWRNCLQPGPCGDIPAVCRRNVAILSNWPCRCLAVDNSYRSTWPRSQWKPTFHNRGLSFCVHVFYISQHAMTLSFIKFHIYVPEYMNRELLNPISDILCKTRFIGEFLKLNVEGSFNVKTTYMRCQ